jgi:hypothetical protein
VAEYRGLGGGRQVVEFERNIDLADGLEDVLRGVVVARELCDGGIRVDAYLPEASERNGGSIGGSPARDI